MAFADLILTGDDPKLLRKRKAAEKRLRLEINAQARKEAKEEKLRKQKQRENKPLTCLTVNHKPTYSILSYRRLEGEANRRAHNFRVTPAFVSKSEIQSMKSMSRLKNAIGWELVFADKKHVYSKAGRLNKKTGKVQHHFYFKLAFLTLTLSDRQKHSDDYIKEHMLQPFLYWLSRYYNCSYVWKAESQLNGNIHFHLTVDTFIPWKSVRAKWNKLLSKHGYCSVMQDGSNDKGDAAISIKSVLKESECAKDIGGYMSKKDLPKDILLKAFKYLVESDFEIHDDTVKAYKWIKKTKQLPADKNEILQVVRSSYDNASLHCKFSPELTAEKQDKLWYKRVIDGRLWGCSENLSGIEIMLDETFNDFKKEERIFFRQNPDVYNLGEKVIAREKKKHCKVDPAERAVRGTTDEDIEHRFRFMNNVFIHKHICDMKKGGTLQKLIHEQKLQRQRNKQTYFIEE